MIEKLINDELRSANEKFPLFSSWHEAYAVILEEVEEAQEEVAVMKEVELESFWSCIRDKKAPDRMKLKKIGEIRGFAVRGIEELIQVAAMCDKAVMSLGKEQE